MSPQPEGAGSPRHVFLSHSDRDREAAEALATAIRRVSLRQIEVWFSSDGSPQGGLPPGKTWASEVMRRLEESSTLLALVTPHSVQRPWLYFECGHIAGRKGTSVVPVCLGVDPTRMAPPLALYQTYSISDRRGLLLLLAKLCGTFDIHFEEAMAQPVVDECIERLSRLDLGAREEPAADGVHDLVSRVQDLIDRRFVELSSIFAERMKDAHAMLDYSIAVDLVFDELNQTEIIVIDAGRTLSSVLDSIFFVLRPRVHAYCYLEQWVLVRIDGGTPEPLIVKFYWSDVSALTYMPPGSRWRVLKLIKPFTAGEPLETADGPIDLRD